MMKKMDVAVLGIGKMGATHVESMKASPYVNQIYGYEPDAKHAEERGKELEITATADLDTILNNPDIGFVSIAASNPAHANLAEKVLRAGKPLLCEKPIAETLEDSQRVVDIANETDTFFQIGFEARYSKLYMKVKEWIDAGLIGDVVNSHCRYYASEFHCKNTWRSNSPGTLIGEKLSHYLDLQRWWTGSPVEEVYSMHAPNVVDYFNHPDNHQINLRFKNDSIGTLIFNMFLPESDHSDPLLEMLEKQQDDGHFLQFHIFGTKGAIETDVFRRRIRRWTFTDGPEHLISELVETITFPSEEDTEWFHNVHGQNLRLIERVANGLPPENPAADSLETMKVCFATEMSENERRVVKLAELN